MFLIIHILLDIKPTQAPASSGSWLGRFWKRAESTPGPVKASLGDETSFYYDKEQKRWVNKKVMTKSNSGQTTFYNHYCNPGGS
jgi:hypothetical protein